MSRLFDFAFRRSSPPPTVLAPVEDDEASSEDAVPVGEERRRWPRVQVELQARIRFASADDAVKSHTFDISPGGMFLRLDEVRPKGTKVRVTVEIGNRRMLLDGLVVRVADGRDGPKGVGIAFEGISQDDQEYLEELVEARRDRHSSRG